MASTDFNTKSFSETGSGSRVLPVLGWAVVISLIAYFVWREVPQFFVWTKESYGSYYWPKATIIFPHVVVAILPLLIGPFQFWPMIRNRYPKVHRTMGKIYVVTALLGSASGLYLAVISQRGLPYATGLFGLAVAGLLTTSMAYIAIRRRNFIQHKQWMVRSYVVVFGFVTIRAITTVMIHTGLNIPERFGVAGWACWAVPLLLTEVVIQGKQVFASKTRSAT